MQNVVVLDNSGWRANLERTLVTRHNELDRAISAVLIAMRRMLAHLHERAAAGPLTDPVDVESLLTMSRQLHSISLALESPSIEAERLKECTEPLCDLQQLCASFRELVAATSQPTSAAAATAVPYDDGRDIRGRPSID